MTTLTITPNFTEKTMVIVGKIAVGEKVQVSVVGVTDAQKDHLRIRFRYDGERKAQFPLAAEDVWTHSGSTATAIIDLNTVEMRGVFENDCDGEKHEFILVVDNTDDENLYSSGRIMVKNWPAEEGADVPYSLSAYPDTVEALQTAMTTAQGDIDAVEALMASHTHGGGASATFSHNNLTDKGNNTHAQLDALFVATEASLATVSGEANTALLKIAAIKSVCQAVVPMPEATTAQVKAKLNALLNGLIAVL